MKRNFGALLFGILLLILGGAYLGSAFGLWPMTIFVDGWWALALVIFAVYLMLTSRPNWLNVGMFLLGVFFFIREQSWTARIDDKALFAGMALLYLGVMLIVHFVRKPKYSQPGNPPKFAFQGQPDFSDYPEYTAVLSGLEQRNCCKDFKGAKITAVLGGIDLDLSDVSVSQDVTVYVTCVLGGADIRAPKNCRIVMRSQNFLGGSDNKAQSLPMDAVAPLVTFVCTSVLGGTDIL